MSSSEEIRQRLQKRFQEATDELHVEETAWTLSPDLSTITASSTPVPVPPVTIHRPSPPRPSTPDPQIFKQELRQLEHDLRLAYESNSRLEEELRQLRAASFEVERRAKLSEASQEEVSTRQRRMDAEVSALSLEINFKEQEKVLLESRLKSMEMILQEKEKEIGHRQKRLESIEGDLQKRVGLGPEEEKQFLQRIKTLEYDLEQKAKSVLDLQNEKRTLQEDLHRIFVEQEPETKLLKENLHRLGQQNKELLQKLQDYQTAKMQEYKGSDLSPLLLKNVDDKLKEQLESMELALTGRDRILEDQQKVLDEKKSVIEGLFIDLKALDEQALLLLEEKNRSSQDLVKQVEALKAQNKALEERLAVLPVVPPAAPASASAPPVASATSAASPLENDIFQQIKRLEGELERRDAVIKEKALENKKLYDELYNESLEKEREYRLLRESMNRLAKQNKELLTKIQEQQKEESRPAETVGPRISEVNKKLQEQMESLELSLTGRDRVLEDQQKSLDEKKSLIDGLISDLRALDDQALNYIQEKDAAIQQLSGQIAALSLENQTLKKSMEEKSLVSAHLAKQLDALAAQNKLLQEKLIAAAPDAVIPPPEGRDE